MNVEHQDIGDAELAEIAAILKLRRNFSIFVYKDKCMKRRVAIRMRSNRCTNASAYCELLRQSERELDQLQKVLTIHVSQFFRNPSMFEKLRKDIIPVLYQSCAVVKAPLRICSLGCAGGEEPYSMAILLREHFAAHLRQTATSINAIDIDEATLHTARKAEFSVDRLKYLPDQYRARYFHANGSRMLLARMIREMVTFHQGDISVSGNLHPCDLLLCRNTLIYFNRHDQESILERAADILPHGGILVLGKSETLVGNVRDRFTVMCPVERIYRRN